MSMSKEERSLDKIEAIQNEFHERNDLEIEPGYRVNDLVTRDECNRAIVKLNGECNTIVRQIEEARLDHARGKKLIDNAWVMRAQTAIRWNHPCLRAERKACGTGQAHERGLTQSKAHECHPSPQGRRHAGLESGRGGGQNDPLCRRRAGG